MAAASAPDRCVPSYHTRGCVTRGRGNVAARDRARAWPRLDLFNRAAGPVDAPIKTAPGLPWGIGRAGVIGQSQRSKESTDDDGRYGSVGRNGSRIAGGV